MGIFNKKPKKTPIDIQLDNEKVFVEVVPSKNEDKQQFKQAVNEAKAVSEKLNSQLLANGFTIKIFVATGGKTKGKHK